MPSKQSLASSSPPGMKVAGFSCELIEALGKPSSCLSSLGGRQGNVRVKLCRQLGSKQTAPRYLKQLLTTKTVRKWDF